MSRDLLLRALEAELRSGPPDPLPRPELSEPAEVKRARLLCLADELVPGRSAPVSEAAAWVFGLRGRVCDLSPGWLDVIARRVQQTAEIRRANRFVNRDRDGSTVGGYRSEAA